MISSLCAVALAFSPTLPMQSRAVAAQSSRAVTSGISMINLFGNSEESTKRRDALNFREAWGKAVFVDKIIPGTEGARLEREGKIQPGDEIVMVSATFGDEMWSSRGCGKMRLEKSIAVRQGMTISFVVESPDKNSKKNLAELKKKQDKEAERLSRLQKMMTAEVEAEKKKGFWPWEQ